MEINYKTLEMPREKDECIMERLVREGFRGAELVSINRARKQQEALFMSDIATADGRKIDKTYLRDWKDSFEGQLGKHRSRYKFGLELPLKQDWVNWESALKSITLGYCGFPIALGKWRETSPRIWRVFYDKDENCIEVMSDKEGLVQYDFEARRRFKRAPPISHVEPRGTPSNAEVASGGKLKLLGLGDKQFNE